MVKSNSANAYTLIELLVVIAVMGFVAALSFYGIRGQDKTHYLSSAQKDFINNMRSLQNKAKTGADGLAVRSFILTNGSTWSNGITYTITGGGTKAICFVNPNLPTFTTVAKCESCVTGSGYICTGTTADSPAFLDVTFSNGVSAPKTVRIEGSGMEIGRIYERN